MFFKVWYKLVKVSSEDVYQILAWRKNVLKVKQKPTQTTDTSELIDIAKEHVLQAAEILRSLGPERERISWILEDAVGYLYEPVNEESNFDGTQLLSLLEETTRKEVNGK